jgi:hypothetical protein
VCEDGALKEECVHPIISTRDSLVCDLYVLRLVILDIKDQYICTENVNVSTYKYNENTSLRQTDHIKEYEGITTLAEVKGD